MAGLTCIVYPTYKLIACESIRHTVISKYFEIVKMVFTFVHMYVKSLVRFKTVACLFTDYDVARGILKFQC